MLRYMTAGESHGKGIVTILDGVPAGLKMDEKLINLELKRRMEGYGRGKRMSIEKDKVEIISGLRKGKTIGSPVSMVIYNKDFKIDKLADVKKPRPGHADLAGMQKYGLNNAREVLERASARETAMRVAAGSVAKMILNAFDIKILSHIIRIGSIEAKTEGLTFNDILNFSKRSKVHCADKKASEKMCKEIDKVRKKGDTLGGIFEVIAKDVPPGLGSYSQWDKRLDGALARAVMSIPAVKAVSVGAGTECSEKWGSKVHDEIIYKAKIKEFRRLSNNSGGLEGGITNGAQVIVKGYMKPIATLMTPLRSVNISTKKPTVAATERADVSAVAACGVVGEAVIALELASAFLDKFGGDSITEISRNYKGYLKQLKAM